MLGTMPSSHSIPSVSIAIDRGGTFTDIYAQILTPHAADPSNVHVRHHVLKLLSVDPANYADAPTEGIRRVLALAKGLPKPSQNVPVPIANLRSIRMGTTIATNALLERDGAPCALVVTSGMKHLLSISNQTRPKIFDLSVTRPPPLPTAVVEARERLILEREEKNHSSTSNGNDDSASPPSLVVDTPIDRDALTSDLRSVLDKGITSLAVALMHSYARPEHEIIVRDIALSLGFTHVSLSSTLSPMVRIVPRAFTAAVDAYLTPGLREYVASFRAGFENSLANVDVQFMRSDGGLCAVDDFHGYVAVLSGPAGGVVGYARTAYGAELAAPERREDSDLKPQPLIGFDMGGTSTDVSRYAGRFEHVFETHTAGVAIQAPQLDINTVAAGGGSRLFFRAGLLRVGPESAGAHPGPVCYRKNGHLAVTDANLFLGRIEPSLFPHIFGPNADQPLDIDATRAAFEDLTVKINEELRAGGQATMSAEQVADGFLRVANETMCRPIRQLTEAKGHDVREHALACFGGAGGQHACAIARALGIRVVFVHRYSGVLSAFGIALADSVVERQQPIDVEYHDATARVDVLEKLRALQNAARDELSGRGFEQSQVQTELYMNLRYDGTDFGIMVQCPTDLEKDLDTVDFAKLFVKEYSHDHGFHIPGRKIIIDDIRVRALGSSDVHMKLGIEGVEMAEVRTGADGTACLEVGDAKPALDSRVYDSGRKIWRDCSVWRIADLPPGRCVLPGPCTIVDTAAGNTIVVDPDCVARVSSDGNVFIEVPADSRVVDENDAGREIVADPVQLSIYAHRFMGIAEQMGRTLQRTSISTNIKERLDFSCALFDETGGLVANAPHVPVHLGAMQDAVRYQIRALGSKWGEGEVLLSNHPEAGGTHLPDITIITPVYYEGRVVFYVASRGHHADIGGETPGSMPPFSKSLGDEGLAVRTLKLVKDGLFQEEEMTKRLQAAGCRCIRDVISDLRAQVAANTKGIALVRELMDARGSRNVQAYMHHIQSAASTAVRGMLRELADRRGVTSGKALDFHDAMDDGTAIKLAVEINKEDGTASFNFAGTGDQNVGNLNAPRAVTSSAIIYALRCLVHQDIPLNQGCLEPVTISIPKGSILEPNDGAAVVGGNVLTSQRVTDVVLGAFGACAASQGCMNNLTFGNETMGYYETIGGGSGAGPGWHGASGVQVHMTNTRITDAEILERRYPVIVRRFELREGSGGNGQWCGGDGIVRELEFTQPVTVSLLTERRTRSPWGLCGGTNGLPGRNELVRDGEVRELGGKSVADVHAGDVVRVSTPGGGGYGR